MKEKEENLITNYFEFEGQVIYTQVPEVWTSKSKAKVKLEGSSPNRVVVEFEFSQRLYNSLGEIDKYDWVTLDGHFEEIIRKTNSGRIRNDLHFVCDHVLDVRRENA